ncbi:pyruvate kinase [Rufibacter glacialis]|uniref:pyruvate kinase n=1 Tax=Rufibacter glacialis TaxID=1259555 RepID=A0A5M8QI13_9BACT|nr:pyruvate kinase [Rufibacter glacialis]KAA6434463.1 pyruvate kinase [Rufibacter glacialis]
MERIADNDLAHLLDQIEGLLQEGAALEETFASPLQKVHPVFAEGARNLIHYLALRKHDIRVLQMQLSALGLSSLGRAESHVLANLMAVRNQLRLLWAYTTHTTPDLVPFPPANTHLSSHITALLGEASPGRKGRIMITFSSDIAEDYTIVRDLLLSGMNCARINCAHDDITVWEKMVGHIKRAEQETGLRCSILFDLMGPKLRTGVLKPGPQVVAIHPRFNEVGEILAPAKVWLAPKGATSPSSVDLSLEMPADWLANASEGDTIFFKDTRKRKRAFTVVKKREDGLLVHLLKSAFLSTGTQLMLTTKTGKKFKQAIGELPSMMVPLNLRIGQELVLHRENIPGEAARYDHAGYELEPAHISCTLPEVFARVKPGEPILFDDGEIEGVIEEVTPDLLRVRITAADEAGSKLRPDKGINLPESDLQLHKLTEKDREDLAKVVPHADVVNLSFVSHPGMVEELQEALVQHGAEHIGIMLKIETKAAFAHLPHLLLTLMRKHPAGIMIARGDLAVELGWKRLAEVQEEILWITEAAHLPVVWATQVLEKLTKKGRPSRAEITDAAMAQRADCVMLNKGPFILKSISLLDDIMKRMQEHQHKKTSLLRMLHVSEVGGQLMG